MKKLLLFASMLLISFGLFAQETVTLTFTAKQQNEAYQQLDSVLVTNVTRGWTEVLYYPDTVLTMNTVGIPDWENERGSVKLYQNVPNPFSGITDFKLVIFREELLFGRASGQRPLYGETGRGEYKDRKYVLRLPLE